jgi:hypothetical protein
MLSPKLRPKPNPNPSLKPKFDDKRPAYNLIRQFSGPDPRYSAVLFIVPSKCFGLDICFSDSP